MKGGNTQIYISLANKAKEENRAGDTIHFLQLALKGAEGEERLELLFALAMELEEAGDLFSALDVFGRIQRDYPEEAGADYGMAMVHESLGEVKKAEQYYLSALNKAPDYASAAFFLANLYDTCGRGELAEYYYHQVLKMDEDYMTYNNLGSFYEERGQYGKAKAYLEKSIALRGDYFLSHFNLGVVEKALGNREAAQRAYLNALDLNPGYENVYLNLSALYIEDFFYEKSEKILRLGIKNAPKAYNLYYNLSCSMLHLHREEEAFAMMQKALELSSDLAMFLKTDEDFIPYHEDERYQRLLEEAEK